MANARSRLEQERENFHPILPRVLEDLPGLQVKEMKGVSSVDELASLFPHSMGKPILRFEKGPAKAIIKPLRIAVFFSGGQAPGGHNVIWGLWEGIKKFHTDSKLFGFLGGPSGIIENYHQEITEALIQLYRNRGGFDLLGSGRTKIETEEQLSSTLKTVSSLELDGVVVIGGDDSNTNAAILAEYFIKKGCFTRVIGVPKTIDGDLKNEFIETSFGFDTACKVYAELIGNIARDMLSAKKYYHFVKLMGRSASHVTLECALEVQPNYTLIGEEVANKKRKLKEIINEITDLVIERSKNEKNYGLILIPEGLIEFIPEIKNLIQELNCNLATKSLSEAVDQLSSEAKTIFNFLPEKIQKQLLMERDPHGNVQVSLIATEELLIEMVKEELKARQFKGKFSTLSHFFGYEGRAAFPSNFDANYTFALGCVASALIALGFTGYMARVSQLTRSPKEWQVGGIPLAAMMHMETRKGKEVPVIAKSLVDLAGKPFQSFAQSREKWRLGDQYLCPGPIQFFGPSSLTDSITSTLRLERG